MTDTIHLKVIGDSTISLHLSRDEPIVMKLEQVDLERVFPNPYSGEYEAVSALFDDTVLHTYGKSMQQNLVIHPIPIYRVENPSGGMTITIGQ